MGPGENFRFTAWRNTKNGGDGSSQVTLFNHPANGKVICGTGQYISLGACP